MIVGLKKRRASKEFYDLGILAKKIVKSSKIIEYIAGRRFINTRYTAVCLVKAFDIHKRGRDYLFESNWVWTQPHLVVKICDKMQSASCKSEKCPYRFRCFTNKVELD